MGPKKTSNNYFPKKYLLIPKLLPNFVHACSRRPLRKQTPQEGGESFLTHDHTCMKAAFCAQEKIVGSRPLNRIRNCVTDM